VHLCDGNIWFVLDGATEHAVRWARGGTPNIDDFRIYDSGLA
jgi:hypothetical protein